ncbi:MAG: ParB N-terminal domain-containing protein, partial [Planctomycetota bacterium]
MKPKKLGRGLESLLPGFARKKSPTPPKAELFPVSIQPPLSEQLIPVKTGISDIPSSPFPLPPPLSSQSEKGLSYVQVNEISPNRFQPRKDFDQESLNELMESIKSAGVLQPVILRKSKDGYE